MTKGAAGTGRMERARAGRGRACRGLRRRELRRRRPVGRILWLQGRPSRHALLSLGSRRDPHRAEARAADPDRYEHELMGEEERLELRERILRLEKERVERAGRAS